MQLTAGAATVNGHALTEASTLQALRPLLGFVGKEDIVDRRLTARELLTLSAQQVRPIRSTCAPHPTLAVYTVYLL